MKMIIILLTLVFSSCSSVKEWTKEVFEPKSKYKEVHTNHQPLEKQRLIPRPGYEGQLTNQVCTKFYGNECEKDENGKRKTSVRPYSLDDAKIRHRLIEFKFACTVGDKRYRVCKDKPGLCRREAHKRCVKWGKRLVWGKKKCDGRLACKKKVCRKWEDFVAEKYIDAKTEYQFLLDGGTECKQGL